jgi:light-regulated signal transduction histidine kinase (bacteriophytochrome)
VLENIAWIQSHKVRKPLANIIALSELMAKDKDYSSEKLEVLGMLKTSSAELDEVIREIVELCNSIRNNT